MNLRLLFPLMLMGLAGCAALPPGACDPNDRDVSIIQKMQCDGSGGYRKTVDDKEARLTSAQAENAMFRDSLSALEAQRASIGQSVKEQERARDNVVATTRKLLDRVRQQSGSNARLNVQLQLAEKDLAALQAQPIAHDDSSQEIAARQRKVQELEQMVKRVRTSVLQAP
ncbi:hypothetical protein YH64_008005 [Achromobacter sp. LC458]|uniref:hypothetical protein n=1 Tax=unclassified Achromobacter TaxID=2626865 RepID=UPI000B1FBA12|nr:MULTISPECIES: hypothetical protein [unclassified Achromobacter]MDX3983622.1 hypothetical protein [Achromobacter sp.]TRM53429.1 hypothetical protein YH64_008005 [Achromobacter sp. LC458]